MSWTVPVVVGCACVRVCCKASLQLVSYIMRGSYVYPTLYHIVHKLENIISDDGMYNTHTRAAADFMYLPVGLIQKSTLEVSM